MSRRQKFIDRLASLQETLAEFYSNKLESGEITPQDCRNIMEFLKMNNISSDSLGKLEQQKVQLTDEQLGELPELTLSKVK
jgi:hypothetical protein